MVCGPLEDWLIVSSFPSRGADYDGEGCKTGSITYGMEPLIEAPRTMNGENRWLVTDEPVEFEKVLKRHIKAYITHIIRQYLPEHWFPAWGT